MKDRDSQVPINRTPSHPTPSLSREDIDARINEALARVRATDLSMIEQEITSGGGSLEMDSMEGVTVIAILEGVLGRTLPGPEDLKPDQYTSTKTLGDLIEQKLRESSRSHT